MVFKRLSSVFTLIFPSTSFHALSALATTSLKFHPGISALRLARALSTLTAERPTFTIKGCPSLLSKLKTAMLSLLSSSLTALERSEEHTSELQSRQYLVCRLLLEKKK